MIIIAKKQTKIKYDKFGRTIRPLRDFSHDGYIFKNVRKIYSHSGWRGSKSTYEFDAKAYYKDSGKFAGNFKMKAKNMKDLKENIKLESDTVHIQLKRSKERMKKK